ncbi:MAG: GTPase HflX [Elusimicrobiota bacterium]
MKLTRPKERVVLVGVFKKGQASAQDEASLEELRRLTETAGGEVAQVLTQRLEKFHPGSLIGSGKIAEVAQAVRACRARTVVFDENLSPAQQVSLEEAIGAKIVDRTRLILDIFAKRARTKEGELQIELAQLSYMLPRLTGSWRAFSQQVGGIGTRGPGERQIEYERRHIQHRIESLKEAIRRMEANRVVQRQRRESVPMPTVAILGYTNAGKSTLLNRLVPRGAPAYADDKLFATLDPMTRRAQMPDGGWAVFTDTVGFISKLPTPLIAAFRSTLEEVARADCLLHVEDGAIPGLDEQRRVVDQVLLELGAQDLPRVMVVNKADLLSREQRSLLSASDPERCFASALTGEGVERMLRRVQTVLNRRWLLRELSLDASKTHHLAEVYRSAQVVGTETQGERMVLRLRVTRENWQRLRQRTMLDYRP